MKLKDRIDELEKRVRELEARPVYVPYPIYPAQPLQQPWYQQPIIPQYPSPSWGPVTPTQYEVTCGSMPNTGDWRVS